MAGYCIYMKCIYSVVFLKLCLNRCFQAQIQTKMLPYIHREEHTLSVVKVLSYPQRAAAKSDPWVAVNDWWCMYVWKCVSMFFFFLPSQSLHFVNWQQLIIRGPALICKVQQGEFEHLSHFKVGSVGDSKYRKCQPTKLVIKWIHT